MKIDFIRERNEFMLLWQRAIEEVELLRSKPLTDLLFFDSSDLQSQKFFELIRHLLALKGTKDFATLVLKPDPFGYFHFHFGKYPGFIHRAHNTDDEFLWFMWEDPGDSPADALGVNSQQYAVLPLPGDWVMFGDRSWDIGVLYGPPDIMECAKLFYPFFIEPPLGFRIEL
ncbi:hypothetical protein [Burkholderia sp. AW49-1]